MVIHTTIPRSLVRISRPRRCAVHPFLGDRWRDFGVRPVACGAAFRPRIDASETGEEIRLTVELPGLEVGDFEVTVDGDVLAIRGEKKLAREGDARDRARAERVSGAFSRSFRVPFDIDAESVQGTYRNGVLTLVVPKPASSQARTIPVETA
jgi:HSP20 family protein